MKYYDVIKKTGLALLLTLVLVLSVGCAASTSGLETQAPGSEGTGAPSDDGGGSEDDDLTGTPGLDDGSETPEPGEDIEFKGTIDSISGNRIVINGQTLVVPPALESLVGQLKPGDVVEIKAKFDSNGQLVLVEIKIEDSSDDNANSNTNTNDNTDDDTNLNTNENANDNDDDSGGDDSGSDDSGDDDSGSDDSGGGGSDDD